MRAPDQPADQGRAPQGLDRADGLDGVHIPGRKHRRLAAVERLALWVRSRCGVAPTTLAALAVVLIAAVAFAVHHFWTGRPQTVRPPTVESAPGPPVVASALPSPGPPGAAESRAAGPAPASAGRRILVDVAGKVRNPGVHELPPGARVDDALRAAGGIRPGTDTSALNRARILNDGEQLLVGAGLPRADANAAPGATGATAPGGTGADAGGPVSLNSATAEQLETLPGIGPVLAQHILEYRTEHGGFSSVDELREVNGIGTRRFADLQSRVTP